MIKVELLIFSLALLAIKYLLKYGRFLYLASKIQPSNYEYSLKGYRTIFEGEPKKIFEMLIGAYGNKKEVSKTWFGPVLQIGIVKPEDAKIILNSKDCLDKPMCMKFANALEGSLFGELEYWHSHRKILNPYFGAQGLKSVITIFNEKVKVLMGTLRKMESKGEFNILSSMMALTLETIIKVMEYDVDIQNQKQEIQDGYKHNLEKLAEIISARMFKFWLFPDIIYTRTSTFKRQIELESKTALKFANGIIQNARKKFDAEENGSAEKNKSFIRALISPKNNLKGNEVYDEVRSILVAAQDTTAIASSSVLLLLAMYKDTQQKVMDELHRVFGRVTEAPYIEIEDLNELVYLEMVINEAMRLFPVIPFVIRTNSAEIHLSNDYIIPKGTDLLVPIFLIHRSKDIWGEDADKFRPERFEKENIEKIHPYGFLPFSKGPRMCVGWRYAMYLLKIKLANFLLRYEVDTSLKFEDLDLQMHVTMNICQGYMIKIKEHSFK